MEIVIEVCPHCGNECKLEKKRPWESWETRCPHCKKAMMRCNECLHADDNAAEKCDFDMRTISCFRRRESC